MSRFNKPGIPSRGPTSPIKTTDVRVRGHQGHVGYQRDAKGELFLLSASFMGGDDNFYESSKDRYARLIENISEVAVIEAGQHPNRWLVPFVTWLRNDANLRTVAMVVAIEAVRARLSMGEDIDQRGNRDLINAALQRADEPSEALAYWLSNYGKPIPWPIKNGIADAAIRLYNEFSYLKYGKSRTKSVSMLDVLRLTHPRTDDPKQDALFAYITGNLNWDVPEGTIPPLADRLPMIYQRKRLYDMAKEERSYAILPADAFKNAGMTWENVSEWSPTGMDAAAWEAIIPNTGIMALIRNLRNFDQAGINFSARVEVRNKISDPEVVRKSKQLPFRWYNAYRASDSVNYASALEDALAISLENVPKLKGKTLVLVDMSGSMFQGRVSAGSNVTYADVASLFGAALKLRNPDGVDLFQYGSRYSELAQGGYVNQLRHCRYSEYPLNEHWTGVTKRVELSKGGSILRSMEKFYDMGGTRTHQAIEETFRPEHDRLILITDEQAWGFTGSYDDLPVPAGKRVYIWNLAGYQAGVSKSGKYQRHTFGGLNDQAFRMIPILEADQSVGWPWEGRE